MRDLLTKKRGSLFHFVLVHPRTVRLLIPVPKARRLREWVILAGKTAVRCGFAPKVGGGLMGALVTSTASLWQGPCARIEVRQEA